MATRNLEKVIASLVLGFVECVSFGAILVGWPNMVLVYQKAGVFSHLCQNSTRVELNNGTESADVLCAEADRMFSLCFSLSSAAFQASSFPIGLIFDRYGFWITRASATAFFIPGILMLVFAQEGIFSYLILPGLLMVSIAGMHIIVTACHLPLAAQSWKATVTAIYNGGIGAGTVMFLAVKLIYENHGVTHRASLVFLAGAWLIVSVNTFVCCPRYKISLQENVDEKNKQNNSTGGLEPDKGSKSNKLTTNRIFGLEPVDEVTFVTCLRTPYLWLMAAWFSLLQLRYFFFVGSMNTWLSVNTDNDVQRVDSYVNAFTYITFGSLLAAPVSGIMTDMFVKRGICKESNTPFLTMAKAVSPSLCLGSALGIALSVSAFFFNDVMVYVTLVLLQLMRSVLFGSGFVYASLVFPSAVYGKCLGFMYLMAAAIGSLQHAFYIWAKASHNFLMVNGAMLMLVVLTLMLPIYIEVSYKQYQKTTNTIRCFSLPTKSIHPVFTTKL